MLMNNVFCFAGVLYRDVGDIALAINAYEQCLKSDPDSRNAGQVWCTMGDYFITLEFCKLFKYKF